MKNKFKVEIFVWHNDGLNVNTYFFKTGREAMDFAYSQKWNTLKVYDEHDILMHQNKNNSETYA